MADRATEVRQQMDCHSLPFRFAVHMRGEGSGRMKRHLLTALAAIALMAVALSGTVAAASGGNAEAVESCREDYATLGFKNRGECVSFFTRVGTNFQTTCKALGGTYRPRGTTDLGEAAPLCSLSSEDFDTSIELLVAIALVATECPSGTAPDVSEIPDGIVQVGCYAGT